MTRNKNLHLFLVLTLVLCLQLSSRSTARASGSPGPRLSKVGNVRVLHLYGTPYEMGRQHGRLLRTEVQKLYTDYFVKFAGGDIQAAIATKIAQFSMLPHIPKDYVSEMRGLADGSGLSFEEVLTAQAFLDIKKIVQCSTVALSGSASAEGEPMLGRNLDFPSLGIAHRHSIITVRHPAKGQTTVSVGWPLLLGTFSGMNQEGVSLAMMEVYTTGTSVAGMPYAFQYRRALENATSTSDVVQLIKKAKNTASNNLMVLDKRGDSALIEITADKVAVRRSSDGKLYATNHHRSPPLAQKTSCRRYRTIEKTLNTMSTGATMTQLTSLLNDVSMGKLNLQAMVFLPRSLRLRLAVGNLPASKGPYVDVPKTALFEGQ